MKNLLTFLSLSVLFIITLKSDGEEQNTSSDLEQNKNIAIVLDNSGSMRKDDPGFLTKEVVANFLTSVDKNTQITIILFDTEVLLRNNDEVKFDTYPFLFVIPLQAEKTVLSSREVNEEPQGTGTILRTKDELKKKKEKAPEKKEVVAPAGGNIGEEETETVLKQNFCPNHPAVKANELCPVCKNAFCKVCIVKKGDKIMCKSCAEKS